MPKFSFPMPGRKSHKVAREAELQTYHAKKPPNSPSAISTSSGLSKAQRFFGTDNDLNIDSPTRDDDSYLVPSSRSSVMSISISESSQLTGHTEATGSVHGSQAEKWDSESGIFPNRPTLDTRASSTILGARYKDAEKSVTDASGRLRNEDSSSTLKSFYDRHNSPLAISQQTSESSSRDLALRKGLPKIIPTSPLLHVESVESLRSTGYGQDGNGYKGSKRKPAKLDFSMLFPRSGRRSIKPIDPKFDIIPGPTPNASTLPVSGPRKLRKAFSRESIRSQQSTTSSIQRPSSNIQPSVAQDHSPSQYGPSPLQRSPMDLIPEHLVPERRSTLKQPLVHSRQVHRSEQPSQSLLQKRSQSELNSDFALPIRPWDKTSAASISSQNTKSSNRTTNSTLSHADLQQKSILSLSDSEGDDSDVEGLLTPPTSSTERVSTLLNGTIPNNTGMELPMPPQKAPQPATRRLSTKARRTLDQFPSIPETSITSSRISGSWAPHAAESVRPRNARSTSRRESVRQAINEEEPVNQHLIVPREARYSLTPSKSSRKSTYSQRSHSRQQSQNSQRSLQQPTPPLSPSSVEFRVDPDDSNRFMAVTKQEEALLAALRQKRAKMREEHEVGYRSPPRTAAEIKASRYSGTPSQDSMGPSKQTVLMYLDTPINDEQRMYTAEPSPDLSDFLGFGFEDESTPRNSWNQVKKAGAPRPDSLVGPNPRLEKVHACTNATARLSAVGVSDEAYETKSTRSQSVRKKTSSVRFSADAKVNSAGDSDDGIVWGL